MPFVSQAQRRWAYAAAKRGEVPKSMVEEFEEATPKEKKLPERVKKTAENIQAYSMAEELAAIMGIEDDAIEKMGGIGFVRKGSTGFIGTQRPAGILMRAKKFLFGGSGAWRGPRKHRMMLEEAKKAQDAARAAKAAELAKMPSRARKPAVEF